MVKNQIITDENGVEIKKRTQRPFLASEIGRFRDRLRYILKGSSARSFARAAGVSETVFRKYLAGTSEPTRPALVVMAQAGKVGVGWLATGEGPMMASESRPQCAQLDQGRLERAVRIVDLALELRGISVGSTAYAQLLFGIYENIRTESAVSTEELPEFMRAVSVLLNKIKGVDDEHPRPKTSRRTREID